MITLLVGMLLGGMGLLFSGLKGYGLWVMIALGGLTLFLINNALHKIFINLLQKLGFKSTKFHRLSLTNIIQVLPHFFFYLLAWAVGFHFLVLSLFPESAIGIESGLIYILAGVIGILAILSPGGLGVREGVLLAYFTHVGMEFSDATTLVVFARLWGIFGEFFIFIVAFLLSRFRPRDA
jgi:uncharacterized membrane protein YbhN (UPF0104 family)